MLRRIKNVVINLQILISFVLQEILEIYIYIYNTNTNIICATRDLGNYIYIYINYCPPPRRVPIPKLKSLASSQPSQREHKRTYAT